jgi:hypothetical protein
MFTSEQTKNPDASIVVLGWLPLGHEYRNSGRGGPRVKPVDVKYSLGLDRLATWNEVMRAISVSTEGVLALDGAFSNLREMHSDDSSGAYSPPEDDLWLATVREMPESKSN